MTTQVRFDGKSFEELRRIVGLRSKTRRLLQQHPHAALAIPAEVSIQLTHRCNLRCAHCFQWNEQGHLRHLKVHEAIEELDLAVLEAVLQATDTERSRVFLWGGEPLMHSRFSDVMALMSKHRRAVNICTNGTLLHAALPSLAAVGPGLTLLVSLDGLGAPHDALRGKGTFQKIEHNVRMVLEEKRAGRFDGEVSLACMVSNETVGALTDFAIWAEQLGVNSVYFLLPWYISPAAAGEMDALFAERFSWLRAPPAPGRASWHSYTYQLDPKHLDTLQRDMQALRERPWRIRIRFQPDATPDDVRPFVAGDTTALQGKKRCLAISNRLEVLANGDVTSCKFFPEFSAGNLANATAADVLELWHGDTMTKLREGLRHGGLTPVCSRCIVLYLNGDEVTA